MVGANHAAFQDAKKVLSVVAVVAVATAELAVAVKRGFVAGELAADAVVKAGVVRPQVRRSMRYGHKRGANVCVVHIGNMERAGSAATLNESENLFLRGDLAAQPLLF